MPDQMRVSVPTGIALIVIRVVDNRQIVASAPKPCHQPIPMFDFMAFNDQLRMIGFNRPRRSHHDLNFGPFHVNPKQIAGRFRDVVNADRRNVDRLRNGVFAHQVPAFQGRLHWQRIPDMELHRLPAADPTGRFQDGHIPDGWRWKSFPKPFRKFRICFDRDHAREEIFELVHPKPVMRPDVDCHLLTILGQIRLKEFFVNH